MALIIEELNRAQRVQARYRMEEDRLTLGRGYHNDVIVDDPHADPAHAEIRRGEDGCYYLRDLDTVNGTQLVRNSRDKSVRATSIDERMIESGDEIQLGKTHFRMTDSDAAAVPTVPLHSVENLFGRLSHPVPAIGLLLAVAGSFVLVSYFGSTGEYRWGTALNLVAGTSVGLLLYAAAWAFIGRVVRHEMHFFTHLAIASLAALTYLGWERISGLLGFNYAMDQAIPLINFAVLAVILPAMLWCACYLATNIGPRWRWGVALALPLAFLGLELVSLVGSIRDFNGVPQISTELKHDNLMWRRPVPMEEFLAGSPELFDIPIEKEEGEGDVAAEAENAPDEEDGDGPQSPATDSEETAS
ncbi:FHA domain-containing protein [Microbulbifer halophilus]|uniref:FHA domain-containing protein n=1 Tax=Microbulbifer halophilus TaxID=453963 RepID=A0ABW5EK48_9GAMM|nr:FHA domain-containing protein [Microbulbifer halophilus]MCW8127636.1 FHA domain-containing protein [Microbulbifer halophilus]